MQGKGQTPTGLSAIAALALLAGAAPLAAQSASDYRLPGATSSPTGRAAGPVDPTDPTTTAPRVRPSATPSSAPPVTASPSPAPSATAAPRGAAPAPRATATPRAAPVRAAAPALAPAVPAQTAPRSTEPGPPPPSATATAPAPLPSPSLPVIMPTPQANPAPDAAFDWRLWAVAAAALLAAIGAALLWRARPARAEPVASEPPVVPAAEPEPPAPAPPVSRAPEPGPAADREEPPAPAPAPAATRTDPGPLTLTLEARRLTASLMATTLSYRVRLTNSGQTPVTDLAVEGDLVSAHSSLPVERQIASDAQRLELRHAAVALAPGESIEFTGDMRLPLDQITPIRAGSAAYFVPLARFRIESGGQGPVSRVQVQTFVIGELPEQPGAALRPFRLDLGPRTYSQVGQRAVA